MLSASTSSLLLFAACVLGALGVLLALPRRGLSPQIIGALVGALGVGMFFLWLASIRLPGDGLPNPNFYLFSLIALGAALRVISHPRPVYAALYFILTILASCGLYVLLSAEFMAFALIIVYAGAILITYLFVIMLATESPTADQVEALNDYDRYAREPVMATVLGFALIAALTPMLVRGSSQVAPPLTYASGQRIVEVPRKVEMALRDAGVMKSDEKIARSGEGLNKPLMTIDQTTGEVTGVVVEYGQGARARLDSTHPKWPKDLKLTNVEGVGFALLADHPGAIEIAGVVLLMAMLGAVVLARKKVELDEREKLAAQARLLGDELKPENSPLMPFDVTGSPTIREAALGSGPGAVGGRA